MSSSDPRQDLAQFVFLKNYARFRPDLQRRETWDEASKRVVDMHRRKYGALLDDLTYDDIETALKNKEILQSMRSFQFGGDAILRKNMRIFNCSYSFFDRPRFLAEAVWLLLCGTGVGFSVQ